MERVAVVTGGAGAIGGAITAALTRTGHTVAVLDREGDFPVDLADEATVRAVASDVLDRHEHVDVLVHAAAAFDRAALAELDSTTWRRVQAVNVESLLWLAQALTPGMAQTGFGRVVAVVSDTVYDPPTPAQLPYIASKAALIGVARTLARTLGSDGITVNCVAPGLTRTPHTEAAAPPAVFDRVMQRQAVKRGLVPEDVAAAIDYLASDGAGAVTGQTICTNGGMVMR